jgi:hypothetical protein
MPNANRQRRIAAMLVRHTRVTDSKGDCTGCLCGASVSRFGHYKHLAELVDELVESALDDAFAGHERYRNNPA